MVSPVQKHREFLAATQNADGGWGFFPRKQSWLEPTAYAMLALHADEGARPAVDRAWQLVRSWQLPDGSWPASAAVREPHWATALAVTLHCVRGVQDQAFHRGVEWLLGMSGSENALTFRVAHFFNPKVVELDPGLKAWPWRPGTSSWVEPTAHALVALKRAAGAHASKTLPERVSLGERMLLERRCTDGGWNYGNRKVLGEVLPSYPETTGIALMGLAGNKSTDLGPQLALAKKMLAETRSPLAKVWLRMGLRSFGEVTPPQEAPGDGDTLVTALDAMATSGVLA